MSISRIATSQMFERPTLLMQTLGAQADKLQTQIATTKQYNAPSDNAGAYLQLTNLARGKADDKAYTANITLAQGQLTQTDSTLGSIELQIQRAQEIVMQVGNGTLDPSNKKALAVALDGVIEDMLALANTKTPQGNAMFGGSTDGAAFITNADGSISYAGTGQPGAIPVSDSSSIHTSETGDRIFGGLPTEEEGVTRDIFAVLQKLSAALKDPSSDELSKATDDAISGLNTTLDQTTTVRASIGARGVRLDLETTRLTDASEAREKHRSAIEDTDITTAISELQKTLTVLQATQASFSKLSSLTLFDYLR